MLGMAILGAASMVAAQLGPTQSSKANAASSGGGNASINLSKTVTSASVTPKLGLTLGVDKGSAIPGDVLTYTAVVSNIGSDFGMTGVFKAVNGGDVTATVAGWYDEVEYFATATKNWVPIAAFQNVQAGYTMVDPSPITTGMSVTAVPSPAGGVTYPLGGDRILGTVMNQRSTGQWSYTATAVVAPALVSVLANASKSGDLRNVVHFECMPRSSSVGQPFIYRAELANPFHSQSSAATAVTVTITMPDGSQHTFTPSTTAALASMPSGGSVPLTATFTVPQVNVKGSTETDAAYLAYLQAVEGSTLSATANGTASGGVTPASGGPATSIEHLPIVTITKSGPATVAVGTTETNPLALDNIGGATASGLSIVRQVPERRVRHRHRRPDHADQRHLGKRQFLLPGPGRAAVG